MILVRLLYILFIGIPLCLICMTIGVLFCLTILGIPIGLHVLRARFQAPRLEQLPGSGFISPGSVEAILMRPAANPQRRTIGT